MGQTMPRFTDIVGYADSEEGRELAKEILFLLNGLYRSDIYAILDLVQRTADCCAPMETAHIYTATGVP